MSPQEEILFLRSQLAKFDAAGAALQDNVQLLRGQVAAMADTARPPARLPGGLKLPALSKYSGHKGEDLLAWLFQANEQLSLLQINDDETRIVFTGTSLTGNAQTWYRAVRMEGSVTTWADFQNSLKAHFYPIDPVKHARDQLHPLVQTGSVRDYTAHFRHLISIIGTMSEDEKLDRYIRGLKTRTRGQVELKEPPTFNEACRLAEMIDVSNDRIFGGFGQPNRPRRQGPEPMDLNYVSDPREKPKFTKLTPEEKERRRREGLCLYCGSNKHQLDGCNLRRPQGKGPQRPNRGA
jgi:hypothetical protein